MTLERIELPERPLTVREVAEFLSSNDWQVRYYIREGKLKAYKLGNGTGKRGNRREWRIWRADLLDFVNRHPNIGEK